ncbi:hypothetical protein BJ165DRAFT_1347402, partial [Panaeolus papilionaceus]
CSTCLGRHKHNTFYCKSDKLWNNKDKAYCTKGEKGQLINPKGVVLCSDWQTERGCQSTSHDEKHECSGCGVPSHGAQGCPRCQKASA